MKYLPLLPVLLIALAGAGCLSSLRKSNIMTIKEWSREELEASFPAMLSEYEQQRASDPVRLAAERRLRNAERDEWLDDKMSSPQGRAAIWGTLLLLGGSAGMKAKAALVDRKEKKA